MSFDMTNNGTSTAGVAGTSTNKVSSSQSHIGLKGSEDLGGGTFAIWQIEQQVDIDNSTTNANGFATRNSFLGLSNTDMGTVLMGRHDTPYRIATRGLDLFADTIADNRSLMGMSAGGLPNTLTHTGPTGAFTHDTRVSDALAYISPTMSGLTIAVGYVPGAELASTSTQVKGAAWSLAGMYNAGPINASLSYQVIDVGTTGTGTLGGVALSAGDQGKAWKLGGGYTMDAFQANLIYEKTTTSIVALAGGDAGAQNNWYLAGKFNVSASDAVKLAYTNAGTNPQGLGTAVVAGSGAKQFSIGYDHNMSKRTMLYALYTKLSNDSAATYVLSSNSTGSGALPGAGASPSAWSFGMRHAF